VGQLADVVVHLVADGWVWHGSFARVPNFRWVVWLFRRLPALGGVCHVAVLWQLCPFVGQDGQRIGCVHPWSNVLFCDDGRGALVGQLHDHGRQ
jgi:hypothetical protein